jgi:YHS domain-containing protein
MEIWITKANFAESTQRKSNSNQISIMKKNLVKLLFAATLFTAACNNASETPAPAEAQTEMAVPEATKYTPEMVVNKKDYTCGMPTTAGISDTCHYEGNAYGFCSAECKAEFQKDPAAALAAAQ